MTRWIEVGPLDSIPQKGARTVRTPLGPIAVFRTGTDEIFALDDRCPHKGGPLSQGIVHGKRVTCPLHNFVIELTDGTAVAPDEGCTASHPVEVRGGVIWLGFVEAAAAQ